MLKHGCTLVLPLQAPASTGQPPEVCAPAQATCLSGEMLGEADAAQIAAQIEPPLLLASTALPQHQEQQQLLQVLQQHPQELNPNNLSLAAVISGCEQVLQALAQPTTVESPKPLPQQPQHPARGKGISPEMRAEQPAQENPGSAPNRPATSLSQAPLVAAAATAAAAAGAEASTSGTTPGRHKAAGAAPGSLQPQDISHPHSPTPRDLRRSASCSNLKDMTSTAAFTLKFIQRQQDSAKREIGARVLRQVLQREGLGRQTGAST